MYIISLKKPFEILANDVTHKVFILICMYYNTY